MSFRPVVGLYRRFYNNEPLPNAVIKIKPTKNDFDLEAGYPVEEMEFTTDVNGELPADLELWANEDGFEGSQYTITEPDGHKWQFILPAGVSAISIQELRANGQPVNPPDTVISLIENTILNDLFDVDFGTLQEDDVPAWDAIAGKFVNRPRGSGGGGGVTSVGLALPSSIFNVTGSPVTTNGTLTGSLKNQTQNQVFAAPDGADGVPVFRLLVAADLPNLPASKITSGTFGTTRFADNAVTFAKLQNIATDRLLGRSTVGTGSVEEISIGSGLQLSGGVLSAAGGGGGSPGGANTQLQFNDGGAFGGDAQLTWDKTNNALAITGSLSLTKSPSYEAAFAVSVTGESSYRLVIAADGRMYFGDGSVNPVTLVASNSGGRMFLGNQSSVVPLGVKLASSHSADAFQILDNSDAVLTAFDKKGGLRVASMADSDAPNGTFYYSLSDSKLAFKDMSGNVHSLY